MLKHVLVAMLASGGLLPLGAQPASDEASGTKVKADTEKAAADKEKPREEEKPGGKDGKAKPSSEENKPAETAPAERR